MEYETSYYTIPIVSSTFGSSEDFVSIDEQLALNCIDLMNVLLDRSSLGTNVFRDIITSGISEDAEMKILKEKFSNKINSIFLRNSILSFSQVSRVKSPDSLILLVYNMVSSNPKILAGCFDTDLLHALMFILLVQCDKPNSAGLVHTASFILLSLSGNREYVLNVLDRNYGGQIDHALADRKIRFDDSHSKSLFQILIIIIVNLVKAKVLRENLFEILFTALCNMSPFVRGFEKESGKLFVWLLERFSRNHDKQPITALMMETIDNCVHYQYEQNSQLIYALLQGDMGMRILSNIAATIDGSTVPNITVDTVSKLITYLSHRLGEVCRNNEGNIDDNQVTELIRKISVIGILPVPHPIVIRQYAVNTQTVLWFTSYLWGTIFTALQYMPIIDWTRVRMIVLTGAGPERSSLPLLHQSKADPGPASPSESPTVGAPIVQEGTDISATISAEI
jgi:hypothetical protein